MWANSCCQESEVRLTHSSDCYWRAILISRKCFRINAMSPLRWWGKGLDWTWLSVGGNEPEPGDIPAPPYPLGLWMDYDLSGLHVLAAHIDMPLLNPEAVHCIFGMHSGIQPFLAKVCSVSCCRHSFVLLFFHYYFIQVIILLLLLLLLFCSVRSS